jgi:predicted PurR-regulated permease PerM
MDEQAKPDEQANSEQTAIRQAADRGREAWRLLGLRLRSVTPSQLLRFLLVLATLAGLGWLLVNSWQALLPFFIGAILAYAVLPAVNWLDRLMPRRLAALLTMLGVLAILGLFVALLIPTLAFQYERLTAIVPDANEVHETVTDLRSSLEDLPRPLRDSVLDAIDSTAGSLRSRLDNLSRTLPELAVNALLSLVNIIGAVIGLLVLPTWLLIILSDDREGRQALDRMLHSRMRSDFWAMVRILDRSFRAFFQRQVNQGLLTGIIMYLLISLLNAIGVLQVEFPLAAALLAGLMALIPEIGPIVVVVIYALAGLLLSPLNSLVMVGSYLVVHRLVSGFVEARSQRKVRDIHPALLIIAIVALSELGLFWLLLSVPIITSLRDLLRYAYGRLSEPPRTAGLLPDETVSSLAQKQATPAPARQVPLTYRRLRSGRATSANIDSQS